MVLAIKFQLYFESHTIEVKTNYPLQNVLYRSNLLGWLSTWLVIVSAYNIRYIPRNVMKQMTPILEAPEPSMEKWQVCVDGACRVEGSEIGIVLQG